MQNRTERLADENKDPQRTESPNRGSDILIIDDEILMRTLIEKYVKNAECLQNHSKEDELKIHSKESGWDLLDQNLEHVRVAVIDILLPRVTGVDLIKDLRHRYPQMGIVAVTGMATEPMKRSLLELIPKDQLLYKPLRKEQFAQAFQNAWDEILPPVKAEAELVEEAGEDLWSAAGALSHDVQIPVVRRRIGRKKSEAS